MKKIQAKWPVVRVSARFELARVRVIGGSTKFTCILPYYLKTVLNEVVVIEIILSAYKQMLRKQNNLQVLKFRES